MHNIVDELAALVTEGSAFMTESSEAELAALQGWMTQRGSVLQSLQRLDDEGSAADRQAVRGLIEQILALDATLVPQLEARLENLGKELLAVRKIHQALADIVEPTHTALLITRAV